ncbi:MAG TPA: hypothetical protein VGJ15_02335 [Pirellulales bacterium]
MQTKLDNLAHAANMCGQQRRIVFIGVNSMKVQGVPETTVVCFGNIYCAQFVSSPLRKRPMGNGSQHLRNFKSIAKPWNPAASTFQRCLTTCSLSLLPGQLTNQSADFRLANVYISLSILTQKGESTTDFSSLNCELETSGPRQKLWFIGNNLGNAQNSLLGRDLAESRYPPKRDCVKRIAGSIIEMLLT